MIKIIEVNNPALEKLFLELPTSIYKNNDDVVLPFENEIKVIFDKVRKNEESIYNQWLVIKDGSFIGRVAAYIPTQQSVKGYIGFIDVAENKEACLLLLSTACNWLKENGIKTVEGPVNFREKDRFWGLMIEGQKHHAYSENFHTPDLYKWFTEFGFSELYQQQTSQVNSQKFNFSRINTIAQRVINKTDYSYIHFNKRETVKFATDFCTIYNQAWNHHPDFLPFKYHQALQLIQELNLLLKEEFIWYAYYQNKPIAFYINIIDLSHVIKPFKGKWNLIKKIKLLYALKCKPIIKLRGIIFGIIPEFRNQGIETGLIMSCYNAVIKNPSIETIEMSWVGDFNPKMVSLIKAIGGEVVKKHVTFSMNF